MHTKLAELAYNLTKRTPINGDDAESVAQVRQWLRDIGSGKLVVGAPVPPKAKKQPSNG